MTALAVEAALLSPLLTGLHDKYLAHELHDYDFVGAFILTYVAHRRPRNKWSSGIMKTCIFHCTGSAVVPVSSRLVSVPALLDILNPSHLEKMFHNRIELQDLTIFDIFNNIRITGIKKNNDNMVNRAIVHWALREWPFQLLTRIPSPMEVLRMQAAGHRVISLFYKEQDLASVHEAMLTYMSGAKVAAKDAFDFLIHDITHMQHFMDPDSHDEQVGIMKALANMNNKSPRKFFKFLFPGDVLIWQELEYLISDMNCYLPHLFKYLLAKTLGACIRRVLLLCGSCDGGAVGVDAGDLQGTASERGIWKDQTFLFYVNTVWLLLLLELGMADSSAEVEAAFYFVYNPLLKMERADRDNDRPLSMIRGEEAEIDPRKVNDECLRLTGEYKGGIVLDATACIDVDARVHAVSAWDEASAGELLRTFFRNRAEIQL